MSYTEFITKRAMKIDQIYDVVTTINNEIINKIRTKVNGPATDKIDWIFYIYEKIKLLYHYLTYIQKLYNELSEILSRVPFYEGSSDNIQNELRDKLIDAMHYLNFTQNNYDTPDDTDSNHHKIYFLGTQYIIQSLEKYNSTHNPKLTIYEINSMLNFNPDNYDPNIQMNNQPIVIFPNLGDVNLYFYNNISIPSLYYNDFYIELFPDLIPPPDPFETKILTRQEGIGDTKPFDLQSPDPEWRLKCKTKNRNIKDLQFIQDIATKAGININSLDFDKICQRLEHQYELLFRNATLGNSKCTNDRTYSDMQPTENSPTQNLIFVKENGVVYCYTLYEFMKSYEIGKSAFTRITWSDYTFKQMYDKIKTLREGQNYEEVIKILVELGYNEQDLRQLAESEILSYAKENVHTYPFINE